MDTLAPRLIQEPDGEGEYTEHFDSLYVKLFDHVYTIVLEKESYLFTEQELGYLHALYTLPNTTRYLLIRLSLRKRQKWHTLDSLEKSYGKDLGDKQKISRLIDQLCGLSEVSEESEPNFIDLTVTEEPHIYGPPYAFAEDERAASLSDLLQSLPLERLKRMGKEMRLTFPKQTRDIIIQKIISHCKCQTTLPAFFPSKARCCSDGRKESLSQLYFRRQILKETGRCVRLRGELLEVLDRLNIIFFRSTVYDPSLFLPALLDAFKKRHHAPLDFVRTTDIFPTREIFLDFREALRLETQLNDLSEQGLTLATQDPDSNTVHPNLHKARCAKDILMIAHSRWKALVATNKEEAGNPVFDKFRCEHILTRVIDSSSTFLGVLKEYDLLSEVLQSLLMQRRWGISRRGSWYNNLALIYMVHMGNTPNMFEKALEIVRNGLEDPESRLVYRHQLERRLVRLEKKLKIPMKKRYEPKRHLKNAEEIYISGSRVRDDTESILTSSRTWWKGKEGLVSVEEYALEHYFRLGYKGHHTESRILSTIYGLLFWEIIFLPVPGAFETPYQTAPLDIMDMSFFSARRAAIETRIEDIENGNARELARKVLEKEEKCRSVCIGVHWSFTPGDILEIIECIKASALAMVCRIISEDYRIVSGGVPDLIVWDIRTKKCKFVEVKSDNDKLQENQKLWIDILLRAGIPVDLCNVIEEGSKKMKGKKLDNIANEIEVT